MKNELEEKDIFFEIIQWRVRCQEKLSDEQKQHNKKNGEGARNRRAAFFVAKKNTRLHNTLSRNAKNAIDFGLWVIAYNFRRSLSLIT